MKLLSLHAFSWGYARSCAALLGLDGDGFSLTGGDGGCHGVSSASGVLHWEEYDVDIDGFFFLTLGSCWHVFYMPSFTPSSFISLQLQITSEFIMYDAIYMC